jgi:hypothetical protein
MANPNVKIVIPANPEELLDLASKVYKKHTTDATKSPLTALQSHTWTTNGPKWPLD